jgi:hypothetical protein
MAYRLTTEKTWLETRAELATEFQRWGVREWAAESLGKGLRGTYQPVEQRRVTLRWITRTGQEMTLVMDRQDTAKDNFRVLFLSVQALRLNEARGIADTMREAYLQIAAPPTKRDPYEVLGIRPDMAPEDVDLFYKAKAQRLHPDKGGDAEAFKELTAAYEAVKARR